VDAREIEEKQHEREMDSFKILYWHLATCWPPFPVGRPCPAQICILLSFYVFVFARACFYVCVFVYVCGVWHVLDVRKFVFAHK